MPPPRNRKRKAENERYIDFTFSSGSMDFRAGMATAAPGNLHLSEAGLSGPGQEEKNRFGKRSEK